MSRLWTPSPVLIAGPCALEDDATNFAVAESLLDLARACEVRVVFKGSFDKANRSAADAPRGPGIERGLEMLGRVNERLGIPVITDVHEPWQIPQTAAVVDAIQIPAFLCRQTDLLESAGASGRPVNLKKGQWMSPLTMAGAVAKIRKKGCVDIAVTERGSFFGYGDLVVDMRNFGRMREVTNASVFYDGTHSLQQPGAGFGGSSGGTRVGCEDLLKAAAGAGADGFFIETHPEPAHACCDSKTMLPLKDLKGIVERTLQVWYAANSRR